MTDIVAPSIPTKGTGGDMSRLGSAANLQTAGAQFEAVFMRMMLKSMRGAKLGDGLLDSKAGDTFRDMQDQEIAKAMATHQPMGIGKAVTDFLSRARSTSQTDEAAR